MASEQEGDDEWPEDDKERNGGRNVMWNGTEERTMGNKGRNKITEKEEATGGDEICNMESEDGKEDDDDERTALETERSSTEAEGTANSSDWTEREKLCADGVVFNGMPKKSWENNNVLTSIRTTPNNNESDKNITWTGGCSHVLSSVYLASSFILFLFPPILSYYDVSSAICIYWDTFQKRYPSPCFTYI